MLSQVEIPLAGCEVTLVQEAIQVSLTCSLLVPWHLSFQYSSNKQSRGGLGVCWTTSLCPLIATGPALKGVAWDVLLKSTV
jgi:hypothetical protein